MHIHTLTHGHVQECRRIGVECIVAPYEADAQLAYLEKEGIVDLVITEDSDLLVFGCKRVLFKMDDAGNGNLIDLERDSLGKANKNLIVSPSPTYLPPQLVISIGFCRVSLRIAFVRCAFCLAVTIWHLYQA